MLKPRVLYIVYWGAAEPLGQSLVLPSVKRLADLGADLTLVTFEKLADLQRKDLIARIRVDLEKKSVRWIPLQYHKRPKAPATGFDFLQGCVRCVVSQVGARPDIVHSRTFVGGLMGLAITSILRSKFIYHNEGFYPDEQVDAGVWKANSTSHRVAKNLERRMYSRADAIIAMSHRGRRVIEEIPAVRRKETPVIVVPSCVDLDHFQPQQPKLRAGHDAVRFVYSGSIGGRYNLDQAGRFVAAASSEICNAHLRVLTLQDATLAASMLRRGGLNGDSWSTEAVPYSAMPAMLADQDAGLLFLSQGLSEHGCSPTKIGEYWAMGLPVVTTPNVSDTDEIIRAERVGVVVRENSDEAFRSAARELKSLLEDEELPARCRRAAERHYALAPACDRQFRLYGELSPKSAGSNVAVRASELGKS
ncbi:MAG TPA: glycosyltransferase [Blastocatellia bacterium]|nr:glycosyltransferase [Blastocatellia bacterium]